jgi:hypothetical protein
MEERSIGFLEHVGGHTHDTIYDLFFTTERVIAVIVQHPTDVLFKFGVTELFLGGHLAKQSELLERRKIAEERRRACKVKTPDELVSSHRFNFEIRYHAVASVEVASGFFRSTLKFHISGPSIPKGAVRFTLAKDQVPNARRLIDLALPSKIGGKGS